MIEGNDDFRKLIIQDLKGLQERKRLSNPELNEFDYLRNVIPTNQGSLTKMNGCKQNLNFLTTPRSPILGIVQTNDSAHNIIVQTRDAVYVISEEELFDVPTVTPSLVPYEPPVPPIDPEYDGDDELYPEALIVADLIAASGSSGNQSYPLSTSSTANPRIAYQLNPDGTPAAFVNLEVSSSSIRLQPGYYRIKVRARASGLVTDKIVLTSTNTDVQLNDAAFVSVANENATLEATTQMNSATPFFVGFNRALSSDITDGARSNLFGAPMSGFNAFCISIKITKTA